LFSVRSVKILELSRTNPIRAFACDGVSHVRIARRLERRLGLVEGIGHPAVRAVRRRAQATAESTTACRPASVIFMWMISIVLAPRSSRFGCSQSPSKADSGNVRPQGE
jgi:hypothetical protein